MVARTNEPDFLDLPWHLPLAEWDCDRLVEVDRGIGRNVVRFVAYDRSIYALKEMPRRLAEREYRLLRKLAEESIPVVDATGVVTAAPDSSRTVPSGDDRAVLITRHLEFSLPYRAVFARSREPVLQRHLVDALAELLVRLHLGGFFWGDCSLSNALFRRDAGALSAYLVDAETGELHPELSVGQRAYDIDIAEEKVAGELMDVWASDEDDGSRPDPLQVVARFRDRYERLWSELTREETFAAEDRYVIDARLRRLNELGFDVAEMDLVAADGGYRLRIRPQVVEPGHHRRRLASLTGLDVQENQARRLLNDISAFGCSLEQVEGRSLPEAVVAHRWLTEIFGPTIDLIPTTVLGDVHAAEAFHEILEHRWFMSEAAGRDVGLTAAVESYVTEVFPKRRAPESLMDPSAFVIDA